MKFLILLIFSSIANSHNNSLISCVFGDDLQNSLCNYESVIRDFQPGKAVVVSSNTSIDLRLLINGHIYGYNGRDRYLSFTNGNTELRTKSSMPVSGFYCLSLDYYMYVPGAARIHIYARADTDNYPSIKYDVFSKGSGTHLVDGWISYRSTLNFKEFNYHIVIEAYTDISGTLALDNIRFSEGRCDDDRTSDIKYCDFDTIIGSRNERTLNCDWLTTIAAMESDDLKLWQVLSHDRFEIERDDAGSETNEFTGDYSTGSFHVGGYLVGHVFDEESEPIELVLKTFFPQDGAHCFSFRFWMTTNTVDWDIIETALSTNLTNVLRSDRQMDHMKKWHETFVDIDPVVPIVVTLRVHDGAYLRLDDFKLMKGKCPKTSSCDFQKSFCGGEKYEYSNWLIGKGRVVNFSDFEHLEYDQNYLFSEIKDTAYKYAQYETAIIYDSGPQCFTLGFIADNTTSVDVEYWLGGNRNSLSPLLNKFSESHPWQMAFVDIDAGKGEKAIRVQISFTGNESSKMVRLRDFKLEPGTCNNVLNGTMKSRDIFVEVNFHCFMSGHFIPQYRTCDGVIDCPMGEDEGQHCTSLSCAENGIHCQRRGHRFCLTDNQQICNEEVNCDDAIDEDPRLCDRDSFCDNYCLNDGECMFDNFNCDCKTGFKGKRCT